MAEAQANSLTTAESLTSHNLSIRSQALFLFRSTVKQHPLTCLVFIIQRLSLYIKNTLCSIGNLLPNLDSLCAVSYLQLANSISVASPSVEYVLIELSDKTHMVRVKPLPSEGPDLPENHIYPSLMGLLMSSCGFLSKAKQFAWYCLKDGAVIHIGLSSTDVEFLLFLRDHFQCSAINFQGKRVLDNPNSFRIYSKPSFWLFIVWQNWKSDAADILPTHFARVSARLRPYFHESHYTG